MKHTVTNILESRRHRQINKNWLKLGNWTQSLFYLQPFDTYSLFLLLGFGHKQSILSLIQVYRGEYMHTRADGMSGNDKNSFESESVCYLYVIYEIYFQWNLFRWLNGNYSFLFFPSFYKNQSIKWQSFARLSKCWLWWLWCTRCAGCPLRYTSFCSNLTYYCTAHVHTFTYWSTFTLPATGWRWQTALWIRSYMLSWTIAFV